MYDSPIEIIKGALTFNMDDEVLKAVQSYGIYEARHLRKHRQYVDSNRSGGMNMIKLICLMIILLCNLILLSVMIKK